MSKQPANNTRVFLDEFDFSGELTGINLRLTQETPVSAGFSSTGPRRVVGNYDHEHSFLGMFEGDDDGYDEQIHAILGDAGDHYLTQTFGAAVEGDVAYDAVVTVNEQPRSALIAGVVLLNFNAVGTGRITRGVILGSKTSTGAEDLTGQNTGTTTGTVDTYTVVFRVLAFTGTNITITVEQSSDNGSGDAYAAVSGLTSGALTAIGVVQASTVAATEAWKRVAISGTYSSALILVTAGVAS